MAATIIIVALRVAKPPNPAYPPDSTGDHGTLGFMLAAGGLGFASVSVGMTSVSNCCNKSAEKGPKRRVLRYIPMYFDLIFIGLAIGAIIVSRQTLASRLPLPSLLPLIMARLTSLSLQSAKNNLGDEGTHCLENMGTYQGCVILMVTIVMTALGASTALVCSILECLRIRQWKKTLRNG